MLFAKNTSTSKSKVSLVKIVLILVIVTGAIVILNRIDFPSPNKKIEKIISNEKLKIVK